ncbi:MAG: class I tRNA ligase family protein [Ilumatobacteraceae bacterium]
MYDLFAACGSVRVFLDVLTNWYVRRSRFWRGGGHRHPAHGAFAVWCRVAAPLLPLTTEAVYQQLTGERSVHLTDWPDASSLPADETSWWPRWTWLATCSATLRAQGTPAPGAAAARRPHDRRARCRASRAAHEPHRRRGERRRAASPTTSPPWPPTNCRVVSAALGPRLGGRTQQVIKAVKSGDWRQEGDTVVAGGIELEPGEYQLKLVVAGDGASTSLPGGAGVVVLDTEVTPSWRPRVRSATWCALVQQARRDAGAVGDRIVLALRCPNPCGASWWRIRRSSRPRPWRRRCRTTPPATPTPSSTASRSSSG